MNKVARAGSAISARAQVFPISGVLLANLAWGIGPILTVAVDMSINSTIFYRVTMWPVVLYFIARNRKADISWPVLKSALIPGFFFGVSTIFGFMSFTNTSIANATLIGTTSSAMMLFIAPRFLKEKITKLQVLFAFSSFCGVALVVVAAGGGGGAALYGDVLALINAVLWSGYFVATKRMRTDGIDIWSFMFSIAMIQAVIAGVWALLTSDDIMSISTRDFVLVLTMTLIPGTVGHTAIVWAQKYVAASTSSLICLLGPVISMFFAWLIFEQSIKPWQMVGAVIVLSSLAGVVRYGTSEAAKADVLRNADPLLNSNP
ncbi:MAG: DMT family transporter [Actinobacteria bacterium]|nr:DMT family transporter [Actinomycetota bacterium]MDA2951864.1 DMT family transporter [Actinomycetota bacterium]